jgi:hypothetical protein
VANILSDGGADEIAKQICLDDDPAAGADCSMRIGIATDDGNWRAEHDLSIEPEHWIPDGREVEGRDAMKGLVAGTLRRRIVQGTVTAGIALTMLVGFNSGHAGAYKSVSTTCTTLEAGFNAADAAAAAAHRKGDAAGAAAWGSLSLTLQQIYLNLNCSYGNYEGLAT